MRKTSNEGNPIVKIEGYFLWPLYYLGVVLTATVIGIWYSPNLWITFCALFAISILLSFYLLVIHRKHSMERIIRFALSYNVVQKELLENFEIPYVLMDAAGRIKWRNEAFKVLFSLSKVINIKLSSLMPTLATNMFPIEGEGIDKLVQIDELTYRIVVKKISLSLSETKDESALMYIAYLLDVTKETALEVENKERKVVFGLIYVDNYEEVIHSIEDIRRPLLIALIDRNINKFGKDMDGVIRKFEKDKYILVFQNKDFETVQTSKFALLDTIREINIGNEMPVTLSIGIGSTDHSFSSKVEYARTAIDLALARGGDQAVVKNEDELIFYGGNSRSVENSTRVKARIKAHAFRELIEDAERVLIMGHKVGDMDSLGAAIGVYACAKHLEKPAHIILNKITTSIKPIYEQIVADKDYPDNLFINNQVAISYVSDSTLLVVVDVNRPSYTEYPELLKYIKKVIVFDHHRVTADHIENPVLSYIEAYASSTCEMITEITQYVSDKVKLKPVEADALFAGITVDTKNFVTKTGVKTFEAAAYLRRNGADAIRVSKFFKNDMASYKARATAVKDAQIYREAIAISVCPSDVVNPSLMGAQAADELLNISGIKASFVLTRVENAVYISARSIEEINVQLIMEKLGGGGHVSVAGAQLENTTIEVALQMVKDTIDQYIEKGEK